MAPSGVAFPRPNVETVCDGPPVILRFGNGEVRVDEKPFEVDFDLGGSVVIRYELNETAIRGFRHPAIAGLIGTGDRDGLRAAGYQAVLRTVTRNLETPIELIDGDGIWIIPTHAIRAVHFRDPAAGKAERPFGFAADRFGE